MESSGFDGRFADALAQAVETHLESVSRQQRMTTSYVMECTATVLRETGLSEVSDALARHHRDRASRRRRVRVTNDAGRAVLWSKSAAARSLMERFGLRRESARILAGQVEDRLLSGESESIAAAVVNEMLLAEIRMWGLSDEALRVATGPIEGPPGMCA